VAIIDGENGRAYGKRRHQAASASAAWRMAGAVKKDENMAKKISICGINQKEGAAEENGEINISAKA